MTTQQHDWHWLDHRGTVSLSDLSRASGLTAQELEELVEYGAIAPMAPEQAEQHFSAECVVPLRAAVRLRVAYDLDMFTVVLLMDGLRRIEVLTQRITVLESMVPHAGSAMPMAVQEFIDISSGHARS
ncbi:chaperone modulator CbpM [Acidovorax sp. A1169]|uniref:chaperone modulator CbpM n=1 Tax=Acidovorax sp. A1169 TaxID=3059524 RepID=UPI002737A037|nr:chaperone modulator CbpM [Acidovorax sp. A1169]MDP4076341.1 chaperone modulator CbpM [Acidovorax sp. A1169]